MVRFNLRTKSLFEFIEDDKIYEAAYPRDAIHILRDEGNFIPEHPEQKLPEWNFVLHLSNAFVFPDSALRTPIVAGARGRLPHPKHYGWGNLTLTSNFEVTSESFSRRMQVPPCFDAVGDSKWVAEIPEISDSIEGPCVLIDLICAHFGHALVDTPARAWFLQEPGFRKLRNPKFIAFPTHGLKPDPEKWPTYITEMIKGMGISPEEIILPKKPVKCESLYVPRRIAPYGPGGCGAPYFKAMHRMGSNIIERHNGKLKSYEKVYFSRSKLSSDLRGLASDQENKIEKIFQGHGFNIIHTQEHSFAEQVYFARNARFISGCIGSQLHLAVFQDRPGLRMFRIAPAFFNQKSDSVIMKGVHGSESTFVVDCTPVVGVPVNQSHWQISDSQLFELEKAVVQWLS